MKKTFLIIAVLLLVGIVGVMVFLARFDVDRYRPLVITQLEKTLGVPVRLERLSLGWRGGIALGLQGLAVYADAQAQQPAVRIESVSATVRLFPLLRKDVQVSSLALIRPQLHLRRSADGALGVGGLPIPAGPPASNPGPRATPAAAVALLISSLQVRDGVLRLTDETSSPPLAVTANDVDATFRNVSLTRPMDAQVRMALFSETQNVNLTGRFQVPSEGRAGLIEGFRLEMDLRTIRLAELAQAVPTLNGFGITGEADGALVVAIERLPLDPQGLSGLSAQIRLTGGRLPLAGGSVLEQITVEAVARAGQLEVNQVSAKIAEGTIVAKGTVEQFATQPSAAGEITIDGVKLEQLWPQAASGEPQVQGIGAASFQASAQAVAWSQLTSVLSGQGIIRLTKPTLINLNILRETFSRLSVLPGVVDKLHARLPESSRAQLTARDTVFEDVELPLRIEQGVLRFDNLRVVTETFELAGTGHLRLDQTFSSHLTLRIDPGFSAAIVQSVNELQHLTDAQGRLELPVVIQGTLPRVAVLPDVQYLASRLLATKAEELLGDFLQKALKREGAD